MNNRAANRTVTIYGRISTATLRYRADRNPYRIEQLTSRYGTVRVLIRPETVIRTVFRSDFFKRLIFYTKNHNTFNSIISMLTRMRDEEAVVVADLWRRPKMMDKGV